jgi:hypothetical protein
MPCSICKQPGHNNTTCPQRTRSMVRAPKQVSAPVQPTTNLPIPVRLQNELHKEFHSLCVSGNLDGAQRFLSRNQINQKWDYCEATLLEVCKNRHLHVADWFTDSFLTFIEDDNKDKYSLDDDWSSKAFLRACQRGNLNVAQWLDEGFCVDYIMDDHKPFKAAVKSKNNQLIKWIQSRVPGKYVLKINEKGKREWRVTP